MERRANLMTLAAMMPTGLLLLALVGGAGVFAADGARVIAFPEGCAYRRVMQRWLGRDRGGSQLPPAAPASD